MKEYIIELTHKNNKEIYFSSIRFHSLSFNLSANILTRYSKLVPSNVWKLELYFVGETLPSYRIINNDLKTT